MGTTGKVAASYNIHAGPLPRDLADPTRVVLKALLQGMIDWGREK
jgi:hypothetical protein